MKILVFAKKRTTKEGKKFNIYISKLNKKDGSEITCGVKFREECGAPKPEECPCYIEVAKVDCNMSTKEVVDKETGAIYINNTLWVSKWKMLADKYEDTSMDDFV